MSPKTPHTAFRFDEETRDKLARAAEAMNVTMTEAARRGIEAMTALASAIPSQAEPSTSEKAVSALAEFLLERDWPSATPRALSAAGRTSEYRTMAAAILNGEAWAIRKAWPEAAAEIADTRPA